MTALKNINAKNEKTNTKNVKRFRKKNKLLSIFSVLNCTGRRRLLPNTIQSTYNVEILKYILYRYIRSVDIKVIVLSHT